MAKKRTKNSFVKKKNVAGQAIPSGLQERYKKALANRQKWNNLIDTAIDYLRPASDYNQTPGDKKGQISGKVFDSTASVSLNQRVASMNAQIFPLYQDWFSWERAPGDTDLENNAKAMAAKQVQMAITKSNFYTEIDQVLAEASISVGALTVRRGDDKNPLIFEALSLKGLIPEESADGAIRNVFFKHHFTGRALEARYYGYKSYVRPAGMKDEDENVEVVECYIYDDTTQKTTWHAWHEGSSKIIATIEYDKSPIVSGRERKLAGEVMGRGRVLDVLPDIVSLNQVTELSLDNAALAIGGMWQADDDGVLSIDNVVLEPRVIIPKSTFSKGLQPLNPGRPFDVSNFIIADLQEKVRIGILGASLPQQSDRTTAYEWQVRMAEKQSIELPMNTRILQEFYVPLCERIVDILSDPALANSPYYIGEVANEFELVPASPVVKLSKAVQISQENASIMGAIQVFGPDIVGRIVKVEDVVRRHLEAGGIPVSEMKTKEDLAGEDEKMMQAQMMQMAQGGGDGQ